MTLTITQAMLAELGACEDAKAALAERFPEGMPLTPENVEVVLAHPEGEEWLGWLLRSSACPEGVRAQYTAEVAPAWAQYDVAVAEAGTQYWAAQPDATAEAWAQYKAARATALAQYDAARAEAIRSAYAAWAAMEAPDA